MEFPLVGKLSRGAYYVGAIKGECILYVPIPSEPEEAQTLVDKIDEYVLRQNGETDVEIVFEFDPDQA